MTRAPAKFYKTASAEPVEGGYALALDGRSARTPAGAPLAVPSRALGEAIAAEWNAQGEVLQLAAMHLTRLANVAIDLASARQAELAEEVARHARTDLVRYLASAPRELRARQEEAWTPHRRWAGDALGVWLTAGEGLSLEDPPAESLDAARDHALALDVWRLTGLSQAVSLTGSAVLALAVERGVLSALEALELSRIDETFQAAIWGEDAEALDRVRQQKEEAGALDRWFLALA